MVPVAWIEKCDQWPGIENVTPAHSPKPSRYFLFTERSEGPGKAPTKSVMRDKAPPTGAACSPCRNTRMASRMSSDLLTCLRFAAAASSDARVSGTFKDMVFICMISYYLCNSVIPCPKRRVNTRLLTPAIPTGRPSRQRMVPAAQSVAARRRPHPMYRRSAFGTRWLRCPRCLGRQRQPCARGRRRGTGAARSTSHRLDGSDRRDAPGSPPRECGRARSSTASCPAYRIGHGAFRHTPTSPTRRRPRATP